MPMTLTNDVAGRRYTTDRELNSSKMRSMISGLVSSANSPTGPASDRMMRFVSSRS